VGEMDSKESGLIVAVLIGVITAIAVVAVTLLVREPKNSCDALVTAVAESPADYSPALISTMLDGLGCEETSNEYANEERRR